MLQGPTLAGGRDQVGHGVCQLQKRHLVGVLDVGHHQAVGSRRGDTEVDVLLDHDLLGASSRAAIRLRTRGVLQWLECGHRPLSSSDRGEDPEQAFRDVVAYAYPRRRADLTDRPCPEQVGLCAGLLGLAMLLKVQPLVFGVATLAHGGPPVFSVGIFVGAEIGTAGIAALFWLVFAPLGARDGFVLIWIAWAR